MKKLSPQIFLKSSDVTCSVTCEKSKTKGVNWLRGELTEHYVRMGIFMSSVLIQCFSRLHNFFILVFIFDVVYMVDQGGKGRGLGKCEGDHCFQTFPIFLLYLGEESNKGEVRGELHPPSQQLRMQYLFYKNCYCFSFLPFFCLKTA